MKANELLRRETVEQLVSSYRLDRDVVWSPSRVLYRLGITGHGELVPSLKRKARRILDELAEDGALIPKPGGVQVSSGMWWEPAFRLAPHVIPSEQ